MSMSMISPTSSSIPDINEVRCNVWVAFGFSVKGIDEEMISEAEFMSFLRQFIKEAKIRGLQLFKPVETHIFISEFLEMQNYVLNQLPKMGCKFLLIICPDWTTKITELLKTAESKFGLASLRIPIKDVKEMLINGFDDYSQLLDQWMSETLSSVTSTKELCNRIIGTCCICDEPFSAATIATLQNCVHTFHFECIEQSIKRSSPNCPLCRKSATVGDVKRLIIQSITLGDLEEVEEELEHKLAETVEELQNERHQRMLAEFMVVELQNELAKVHGREKERKAIEFREKVKLRMQEKEREQNNDDSAKIRQKFVETVKLRVREKEESMSMAPEKFTDHSHTSNSLKQ